MCRLMDCPVGHKIANLFLTSILRILDLFKLYIVVIYCFRYCIISKDINREIRSHRSKKMQCIIKNTYEKALYFYVHKCINC